MDRKIGKLIFIILISASLEVLSSCTKKYEYGNLVTPDVLAGREPEITRNAPVLGDKVPVSADWMLDSDGVDKVRTMVENCGNAFVELDLRNCEVQYGKFGDMSVRERAFSGLENLGSVILPESMQTVPAGLFKDCVNLQSVTLPSRLISIEGHVFEGCTNLREIHTSGSPIYIFSYSGDGLAHPGMDRYMKDVKVHYDKNVIDYASWYQFCWDYTKRLEPKKVSFAEIRATSSESGYEPSKLADGTWGTWFEGAAGDGVGTEITMNFTRMNSISTITFRNGNGNTKNYWKTNRVRDLDIYFGNDRTPVSVTLADTCEKQTLRFHYGYRKLTQYDRIKAVIRSVYEGGKGDETAIAEISINDEDMESYVEDPYTRAMLDAVPKSTEENVSFEHRIWRPMESYPVMLMYEVSSNQKDRLTDSIRCMVYDGTSWTPAQKSLWQQILDVISTAGKTDKRMEFSFGDSDGAEKGGFDFKIQLKRRVVQYPDADYGTPYLFSFRNLKFCLDSHADFSMKQMDVDVDDFFAVIENLNPNGIYRIDLHGVLTADFFARMQKLLAASSPLAINRNYILNMWSCRYADELERSLPSDSICGYFIQVVLPESTERILKSAISVCSDIVSIPSGVKKIEPGAFISSTGSLYDSYGNSVAFEGTDLSRGYSLNGRLLLESIPDSGGEKRVLLYCGNAGELLGIDGPSARSLVLPDSVTEIAPYAFYGADLDSIVFPARFSSASEKCFDMAKVKKVDLSAVDVEKFSMGTAKQFGLLLSSNPSVSVTGDFYCIKATGQMTSRLIQKICDELEVRKGLKIYLDLSGTSLVWNESEKKFNNLPDMFLYDFQNLYWVSLGNYDYLPQNTCRDCRQLRWVEFTHVPDLIAEPSFKGCHATAMALVNGEQIPLWDYAKEKRY